MQLARNVHRRYAARSLRALQLVCCCLPAVLVADDGLASAGSVSAVTPFSVSLKQAGFELVDYQHAVAAYRHEGGGALRLAAEGHLPAPPDRVLRALLAYQRQPGVLPRVEESRVLHRDAGHRRMRVYQRIDLPVVSDRDFTLEVRWGRRGPVRWMRFRAVSDGGVPRKDGVVRVVRNRGGWLFKPTHGGRATFARYEVAIDLAGWIPDWLARSASAGDLHTLFRGVCHLLGSDVGRCPRR